MSDRTATIAESPAISRLASAHADIVRPAAQVSSVRLHSARDLPADLYARWAEVQRAETSLSSPLFRPEFTQEVAAVRGDVEVAVLFDGDVPAGFFPFQRVRGRSGMPVGGRLSDFQGIVAPASLRVEPWQLVRSCGLRSWSFDHLLASQTAFAPHVIVGEGSPCIDLSQGFAHYVADRRANSKHEFRQTQQKTRRIEREIGELRFELHASDPRGVLAKLIEWKTVQYDQTGAPNIFLYPWVVDLVSRIAVRRDEGFTGALSALYVKDDLIAVNFGMRSHDVYHSWMTTYNRDYSLYAPGRILLLKLVEELAGQGVRHIDMGKGKEQFKGSFKTGDVPVTEGAVDASRLAGAARRSWIHARDRLRGSRFHAAVRWPWRVVRPLRDWLVYR